jgi:hypothetical protein
LTAFHIASPENDKGMKWKKKREEKRFLNARKGDLLCAPFQCDFCWYMNIHHREANDWYPSDAWKLAISGE